MKLPAWLERRAAKAARVRSGRRLIASYELTARLLDKLAELSGSPAPSYDEVIAALAVAELERVAPKGGPIIVCRRCRGKAWVGYETSPCSACDGSGREDWTAGLGAPPRDVEAVRRLAC